MANAMYAMAQARALAGYPVTYLRDPFDGYPISQPSWHDISLDVSREEFAVMGRWNPGQWSEFERSHGWRAPSWLCSTDQVKVSGTLRRIFERAGAVRPQTIDDAIVSEFNRHDLVVVCGANGERLAAKCSSPVVIWPHGGDARLAASALRNRVADDELGSILASAFEHAAIIGSHDPTLVGGTFEDNDALLASRFLHFLPMPYPRRERFDRNKRIASRDKLLALAGASVEKDDFLFLVPSRLDLFWKGQDRLLRAAKNFSQLKILFMGWGADFDKVRAEIHPDLLKRIMFSERVVSKRLLLALMQCADAVADQFLFGTYGAAAIEAMSVGTPLVMWLEHRFFESRGWPAPPIYNAGSDEEIAAAIEKIIATGGDDPEYHSNVDMWFDAFHSPRAFNDYLDRIETDALSAAVIKVTS
jgi:glycosyltransferase involved in cell wall biosynthesis